MSNEYYIDATLLTIELDTLYGSMVGVTNPKILYRKPDESKGAWVATIIGTKLSYTLTDNDVVMCGVWKVQTYFEVGGKKAIGKMQTIIFKKSNL
jgi:hypothetical protein